MRHHKRYRRLSFEKRVKLVLIINSGKGSAQSAAKELNVSRQAIYDEIKNHFIYTDTIKVGTYPCSHSKTCHLLFTKRPCHNLNCEHYTAASCERLSKFPFVCNKCEKRRTCIFERRFYNPNNANETALVLRRDARLKDYENDPNVAFVDKVISPIIENGNSLNHALNATSIAMPVSSRTIRRWLYNGGLSCHRHMLPMWNSYQKKSPFNPVKRTHMKSYDVIENRMYADFSRFTLGNPSLHHAQTDTVVGKLTDKRALMTIHFTDCNFMFGYLYKKGSPRSFLKRFETLRLALGDKLFYTLFPAILTDNGTEMSLLYTIEFSAIDGEQKGRVFYCDPYNSSQKGSVEKNHQFVRRVIPRGKSMDDPEITDAFINHMFSHINGIVREKFNNKTPYQLFKDKYGVMVLDALGIRFIEPQDVDLRSARFFK